MAQVRAYGADIRAIASIESVYGTAPAASYKQLLLSAFNPGIQPIMDYEPELGTVDEDTDPFFNGDRFNPSFDVHVGIYSFGYWLKLLLGAPATTGTGTLTHAFTSTGAVPSFSFEEGDVDLTTAIYWALLGCKLNTMSMDLSPNGIAKAQFQAMAQKRTKSGASLNAAPTAYSTAGVYKYFNRALKCQVGGSDHGHVLGGSLQFSNNLQAVETLRGDGFIDTADELNRSASGQVRLRRTNIATIYDAAVGQTPIDLKFIWSTPVNVAYQLAIRFPRAFVDIAEAGVAGPGGIDDVYNWRAARPSSGNLMEVTLINNVAAANY